MPALLITINNEKRGAILEATPNKVIVLGRDEECEVSMPEATGVSRRHCSITYTTAGFELRDLGSTNGTYADDVKVEDKTLLREGVKYAIGNAEFQVIGLNLVAKPDSDTQVSQTEAAKNTPKAEKEEAKSDKNVDLGARISKERRKQIQQEQDIKRRVQLMRSDWAHPGTSFIAVILVLLISFYVGLAIYSLITYGNPLPLFIAN